MVQYPCVDTFRANSWFSFVFFWYCTPAFDMLRQSPAEAARLEGRPWWASEIRSVERPATFR